MSDINDRYLGQVMSRGKSGIPRVVRPNNVQGEMAFNEGFSREGVFSNLYGPKKPTTEKMKSAKSGRHWGVLENGA